MKLSIVNATQNNLKNISLNIPHHQLIAVTGVSGSGKSSLVFEVIGGEGKRQYIETLPAYARQYEGKMNIAEVEQIKGLFPVVLVGQKKGHSSVHSTVGTLSNIYDLLRLLYARFGETSTEVKLSRSLFSFNSQTGACPVCSGLGEQEQIAIDKLVADADKTLREGALVPTLPNGYIMYSQVTVDVLNQVCEAHGFSVDIPWSKLTAEQKNVILHGSDRIKVPFGKHSIESRLKWTGLKAKPREEGYYKGMLPIMNGILKRDRNKNILKFVEAVVCESCGGKRLNKKALSVVFNEHTIDALSQLSLVELYNILSTWQKDEERQGVLAIYDKLIQDLVLLCELGLGYLAINQLTTSLSEGEVQRIRLVNQLATDLSNVLYIFDEPSIGLHPRDGQAIVRILKALVAKGNTVIVVEHDKQIIHQADWIVELGPKAGIAGGQLLFNGSREQFFNAQPITPTQLAFVEKRPNGISNIDSINKLLLSGDICVYRKALNVFSGPTSDSKRKFIAEKLLSTFHPIQFINQSPIGRTPRSNPATYTGLADSIRDVLAKQPLAKQLGFKKGRFSFNNKGGRCESCEGGGKLQIGMHYMGVVEVICELCNGSRFNDATLKVQYQRKSIADIYELSIDEAIEFFDEEVRIKNNLKILQSLGLGYLKLGQSSTTLSGGEAQRIKLATSLMKKKTNDTWFVLDEPTIGLHHKDIQALLHTLQLLIKEGHHILCLSNHELLLQQADWCIDWLDTTTYYQGNWSQLQKLNKGTVSYFSTPNVYDTSVLQTIGDTSIYGAQTHHLKGINVRFPHNKITVVTGVSGSGKSSLVVDTLFASAESTFQANVSVYTRSFVKTANVAKVNRIERATPVVLVSRKNLHTSPRSTVATLTGIYEKYRYLYARAGALQGVDLKASAYSFNHELGACKNCKGLGSTKKATLGLLVPNTSLSVMAGALTHNTAIKYYGNPDGQFVAILKEVAKANKFSLEVPFSSYTQEELAIILNGTDDREWTTVWEFKNKTRSGKQTITSQWKGFANLIGEEYDKKRHNKNTQKLQALMTDVICTSCNGKRLNRTALQTTIEGLDIAMLTQLSVSATIRWFENKEKESNVQLVIDNIYPRFRSLLHDLEALGLGHLTLDRTTATLSGGEGQRLRLAQQLTGSLTGVTYVLDEPTVGLHSHNTLMLWSIIQRLQQKGNTIVIVEHDREIIQKADYIIELGPKAGIYGGEVIAQGNLTTFMEATKAITPHYLKNRVYPKPIEINTPQNTFGFNAVTRYSLKDRDFSFKTKSITALTGLSGAGKTTLLRDIIYTSITKHKASYCKEYYGGQVFQQVVFVEQRELKKQQKEILATTLGIIDVCKTAFYNHAKLISTTYKKSYFDFRHKDGRCSHCSGQGEIKISMDFLDDIWQLCEECNGNRYNDSANKILIENKSIAQVLQLSISELLQFFTVLQPSKPLSQARDILKLLIDFGLGHLAINQSVQSLSGGEKQRLQLALALNKTAKSEETLFLLDEPSTGLHYKDIDVLIEILHKIVRQGHTIIFVEHNPYLIAIAHQEIKI